MFKMISRFRLVGILVLLLTTLAACSSSSAASQMSVTTPSSMTLPASATSLPRVMPQAFATPSSSSVISQASSMAAPATETRVTIDQTNVRTATSSSAPIDHVDPPNTTVTIYATVSGEIISGGGSTWYRVSSFNNRPLYIYGGDLGTTPSANTNTANSNVLTSANINTSDTGASTGQGKIIVVSISQQELDAYDNGQLFVSTPVATGRPQLPTITGTYHIFAKYSPYRFISPWPIGSPYYYAPVTANYAMEWAAGGYFIHNAPWRGYFGKGANNWHSDSLMGEDPGTHGCIDVPTSPMSQLFSWADIGTTVRVDP